MEKKFKSLLMPKKTERGTLWDFSTSIPLQNSKKIEGGPFVEKKMKKLHSAEKNLKGRPFGLVRYCMLRGKPFWFSSLRAALVHRSCLSFRSDNFLLKLLGQQVAMDNQVNNMHHLSSKPVEAEQASQQNRTGSVNSNNHVRNQFMNMSVNPAAAVNNSMVRPYLNYSSYSELPLQIRIAV